MDSGRTASGYVAEHALPVAVLAKRRLGFVSVELEPSRRREQILVREPLAPGEQQGVGLPKLPVGRGELGKLRREIRSGMHLGVRKVSPDKAKAVEAIEEGLHRPAGGEAVRTPEVSIFDQRQPGLVGAGDVIGVCDRGQRAIGQGGHPVYVSRRESR